MGCSAAKNLAVEPLNGASEGVPEVRKVSVTRRASEVPALEGEEPQTEMLDNNVNNLQEKSNGLSFDIGFGGEEGSESIIRKHPPKRFQRLEEQQTSPNLSLARLQEKLDEAEIRRQQILQQRVASAKVRNALRRQNNVAEENGEDKEEESNLLKVPPDISHSPEVVNA